jgi:hypothetical protein
MFPIYCPLIENFSFNSQRLKKEIDEYVKPGLQERTLPFKDGKSIYDSQGSLHIASDDDLNNTSRYQLDAEGNRIYVGGKYKTYNVFNLTYLPEEPESLIDIYNSKDPKKTIFWHKYLKPFTWREELENSYLKESIEQFPWEYIQGVRVIYMDPPSIGQIHRDSHTFANKKYFDNGFASITFNVDTGGGVMKFLDNQDKEHSIDSDTKVYHFDDSAAHGVTPIESPRYQIRMWGKLKVNYESLMQQDKAVLR